MNNMENRNLDGSLLSFEQDSHIKFEPISHTYTVDGVGNMTSVSSVIEKFFNPFDAEYWSLRKCFGDELAAEKLREEWDCNGKFSSQAGTHLHEQIENYLNGCEVPSLQCEVNYDGKYVQKSKTVDITKEWEFFKAFDKNTDYTPFRTEWRVYDEEARMAGTIDLLCSRNDGTYEIYDWKRSNRIDPAEKNKWASGINGLEHLTDTSYIHYCLQQNLYRYILEKNYGLKVSRMNLVVLHPDYTSYRIVNIPIMNHEVEIVLRYIR